MPKTPAQKGSWILFGLGGLAAACGALAFHRSRIRPQGKPRVTPTVPLDWNPEQAPDLLTPAETSPAETAGEAEAGSPSPAGSEPWLEPLRLAMEKTPHAFGYGKSAWTAPLLARYLQDTRGLEAPLPAVRKALKDLGYRWEQTRYVKARAGVAQDGFASDGMG